jgi:formate/nitrite transporter FocA (FNT family)
MIRNAAEQGSLPSSDRANSDDESDAQNEAEQHQAEERSSPSGRIVYRAIRVEGEEELERSTGALFWSGLAAGLSMGFSMIAQGLLVAYLPRATWTPLVSSFGYSLGFLIVVLGRQQLFTENTLTPILPLLQRRDLKTLVNVLRLWAVVLVANLLGGCAIAWISARTPVFDERVMAAFIQLGHQAMMNGFGVVVLKGIFAGWLIALMVWLLPFAESARTFVIIIITYIVALGGFSHIIAGGIDTFTLAAVGEKAWGTVLLDYILPALIGNIIGGVMLVAVLNHAQVVAGEKGMDI